MLLTVLFHFDAGASHTHPIDYFDYRRRSLEGIARYLIVKPPYIPKYLLKRPRLALHSKPRFCAGSPAGFLDIVYSYPHPSWLCDVVETALRPVI